MSGEGRIGPAARRRRAALADLLGGIVLATVALLIAPGLGYIAFFGVPLMLGLGLWVLTERGLRHLRRQRGTTRRVAARPDLRRTARDR